MTKAQELAMTTGKEEIEAVELRYDQQWEDTPIWIRGDAEKGYFATMGAHRITEAKETLYEVQDILRRKEWNVILNIVSVMTGAIAGEMWNTMKKEELEQTAKELVGQ